MRINQLTLTFIIILTIFFLDVFTDNGIAKLLHSVFSNAAYPLYIAKTSLENYFEKNVTVQYITIFENKKPELLDVLSVELRGLYVRNLKKRGIIINEEGKLIGFVEKTGQVGYVTKWWESEFPVTISATDLSVVGYYKKYRITIPDPTIDVDKLSGMVYLSEYMPYGKLLKERGINLGVFKEGEFLINIPKIRSKVILLEDYTGSEENPQK